MPRPVTAILATSLGAMVLTWTEQLAHIGDQAQGLLFVAYLAVAIVAFVVAPDLRGRSRRG